MFGEKKIAEAPHPMRILERYDGECNLTKICSYITIALREPGL